MNGSLLDNRILTLDQATPGTGPISPVIDQMLSPRSDTYLTLDHNIRTKVDNNFTPIINAQNESSQQYVNDKYVNFTGREQISPTIVEQTNLKGHDEFHNLSYEDARVTTNQTTNFSYSGNAQREHDGANFYRYEDTPRVTTNQTTNFSYSGNAQREHDGSNFWRYEDNPRVTTNQTTNFSYSGNAAGTETSHNQMNRVQFTGTYETYIDENGQVCNVRSGNSGVTNWGQGSLTLVEDYYPGSNGAMNIQLDPDEKLGFTEMRADWDIVNSSGSGSYAQAIPNAERFQQVSQDFIGEVQSNPNKSESVDNRQTANYLITNLQQNDFSIYQRPELRNKTITDPLFIDQNAQDYSGVSTQTVPLKRLKEQQPSHGAISVFNYNNYNPNSVITHNTYGQVDSTIENTFLYQSRKADNSAVFMGKGYPGTAASANDINGKNRILLDTDSLLSSKYLDNFSPNGCLNNNQCVF
uniref:Uncharacterized protein n=1 Tax=viral metagenome TaxID=1070528 RepID=A0A6C0LG10_9ZZZZ